MKLETYLQMFNLNTSYLQRFNIGSSGIGFIVRQLHTASETYFVQSPILYNFISECWSMFKQDAKIQYNDLERKRLLIRAFNP